MAKAKARRRAIVEPSAAQVAEGRRRLGVLAPVLSEAHLASLVDDMVKPGIATDTMIARAIHFINASPARPVLTAAEHRELAAMAPQDPDARAAATEAILARRGAPLPARSQADRRARDREARELFTTGARRTSTKQALAFLLAANQVAAGADMRGELRDYWASHARTELRASHWADAYTYYEGGFALLRDDDLAGPLDGDACERANAYADLMSEGAYCLHQLQRLDDGAALCARARAICERTRSAIGVARAVYHLSGIVFDRGDIAGSVALAREAVAFAREANDSTSVAMHLFALGRGLFEQGKTREAAAAAREGSEIAAGLKSPLQGGLINMLANIASENGEIEEADAEYVRAIAVFVKFALPVAAAIALSNRGNLAFDRGDLERSRRMHSRALTVLAKHGDERSCAITRTARAGVLTELGLVAAAQRDLDTAIEILARIGQQRRIAFVRTAYARLAEARGAVDEALAHYAETEMSLADVADELQIARGLYAQAGLHAEAGDPAAGAALIDRADAIHAPHVALAGDAHRAAAESAEPRAAHPGDAIALVLRDIALARIAAARARATGSAALRAEALATAARHAPAMTRNSEARRTLQRLRAFLDAT